MEDDQISKGDFMAWDDWTVWDLETVSSSTIAKFVGLWLCFQAFGSADPIFQ